MTEWRDMIFFDSVNMEKYKVSTDGDVVDISTNQQVIQYISTNGHCYLLLDNNDGSKRLYLQEHIVAATFLEIPLNLYQKPIKVIHLDNNLLNNAVSNLKIVRFIEEWKHVVFKDFDTDYCISNIGNVMSLKYGKSEIMKTQIVNGCRKIAIRLNDRYVNVYVHRLVAMAFAPNPDLKTHTSVNHIDGRRTNSHYLNLEWVTPSQNTRHAVLTGLHNNFHTGIDNPACKYTEETIHQVCKMLMDGYTSPEVVKTLNVSPSLIHRILYENRWKHISSQYDLKNRNRK